MPTPDDDRASDVVVIGAGLIGLASAYKLLLARPGLAVRVLEKEAAPGRHQSSHNSGVLHAGLSYLPGSSKARLAVAGIRQMTAFCRAHGVEHRICGKLVVAASAPEVSRLRDLQERGRQNGLRNLVWVDAGRIRDYEPSAAGVAALWVPEEGVVNYPGVCRALARQIADRGGVVQTGVRVRELHRNAGRWVAAAGQREFTAQVLVNCAGLFADRVARQAGVRTSLRIVPFRGLYYTLRLERVHLVRHLIYPVPDPRFPFLGVHFTRGVDDTVTAGPNAVLALSREGYSGRSVNLRDTAEIARFQGLWRFLARHPRPCWHEVRLSLSRERFAQALQRLVPAIRAADLAPAFSGVRAQAMHADGTLETDFVFATGPQAVHLLNAPSPGATAALAIADEVVGRVLPMLLPTPHPQAAAPAPGSLTMGAP
jgi:L-2-hydroxyglutarate oxidase LhgO